MENLITTTITRTRTFVAIGVGDPFPGPKYSDFLQIRVSPLVASGSTQSGSFVIAGTEQDLSSAVCVTTVDRIPTKPAAAYCYGLSPPSHVRV